MFHFSILIFPSKFFISPASTRLTSSSSSSSSVHAFLWRSIEQIVWAPLLIGLMNGNQFISTSIWHSNLAQMNCELTRVNLCLICRFNYACTMCSFVCCVWMTFNLDSTLIDSRLKTMMNFNFDVCTLRRCVRLVIASIRVPSVDEYIGRTMSLSVLFVRLHRNRFKSIRFVCTKHEMQELALYLQIELIRNARIAMDRNEMEWNALLCTGVANIYSINWKS